MCDRQAEKGSCNLLTRHSFVSCHSKLQTLFLPSLFCPISAATGLLMKNKVVLTAVFLRYAPFHTALDALRTK